MGLWRLAVECDSSAVKATKSLGRRNVPVLHSARPTLSLGLVPTSTREMGVQPQNDFGRRGDRPYSAGVGLGLDRNGDWGTGD